MKFSIEAAQDDPVMDFVMALLHSRTNAHILHWTTGSYAAHMALNNFYDEVPSVLDNFVEAFQGKYGLLHDFKPGFAVATEPVSYLTAVRAEIEDLRRRPRFPQDTELQNLVDEIVDLFDSTLYKLKFLK